MKRFLCFLVTLALVLMTPMAFAVENGAGVKSASVTLVSTATGTTGAKLYTYTFDNVMNNISCDFITGASSTTSGPTFSVSSNNGSSTTLFDTGTNGTIISSVTSSPVSQTTSTMVTRRTFDWPFRTISASVTATSTTQVNTVNCSVSQ